MIYYPDTGRVTISLSRKVIDSDIQMTCQLSHEICHLLHPSREREDLTLNDTIVINEGVSTYFSVLKTGHYFEGEEDLITDLKEHSKDYYFAYSCVKDLLQLDPNAIKILREQTPRIDKLKEEDFDRLPYIVPSELKRNLLLPFSKVSEKLKINLVS